MTQLEPRRGHRRISRSQPSPRRRVLALALVIVIVTGIAATAVWIAVAGRGSGCGITAADAPQCGVWWGSALHSTDSALPAAVGTIEASTGRRLDIVHTYHRWYDIFPTASELELAHTGHQLMLNWEPVNTADQPISWASIANGQQNRQIDAEAARLKALAQPVFVSFSHEPEYHWGSHGSATDFAAAFRAVVARARSDGATNVKWVWDVMGLQGSVWQHRYQAMWPGNAFVDWVAWDPYNWASCRPRTWQSFAQTVDPFYHWLESAGLGRKPFMLAEYGTVEDPTHPSAKANWFAGIDAALAVLPNLKAMLYFDLPAPPANCDWQINTSTTSINAWDTLSRSTPFSTTARLALPRDHL